DDLEPLFLSLEEILSIGRGEVVLPVAGVDARGRDPDRFDVGTDRLQILRVTVESDNALAMGIEVETAITVNVSEDLAEIGQGPRRVAERQKVAGTKELERLPEGIAVGPLAELGPPGNELFLAEEYLIGGSLVRDTLERRECNPVSRP